MMRRYAAVAGRRAPLVVRVPVLTPRLSSYWLALVTPVDARRRAPAGAGAERRDDRPRPPPAGINDAPMGFDDAVREALAEDAG